MRTTLEIDPMLLEEAMEAVGAPTKTAAVRMGLESLVERASRRRLAALFGRIPEIQNPPRRRSTPSKAAR